MRRRALFRIAAAAIFIAAAACSKTSSEQLERPAAVGAGGAASALKGDGEFVRNVAIKNMAAVELSRLALGKVTTPDIKTFAQQMVDEHSAAGDKLKSAVSGNSLAWPGELDDRHRTIADELGRKQGAEFEDDYLKAMVDSHQDFAATLESRLDVQSLADWKTAAAARTQSQAMPEPNATLRDVRVRPLQSDNDLTRTINQWAADMYPVAQKHLDTARSLRNASKKRAAD